MTLMESIVGNVGKCYPMFKPKEVKFYEFNHRINLLHYWISGISYKYGYASHSRCICPLSYYSVDLQTLTMQSINEEN